MLKSNSPYDYRLKTHLYTMLLKNFLMIDMFQLLGLVQQVLPDDMVVLAEPDPDDMARAVTKAIYMLPQIDPQAMHIRVSEQMPSCLNCEFLFVTLSKSNLAHYNCKTASLYFYFHPFSILFHQTP